MSRRAVNALYAATDVEASIPSHALIAKKVGQDAGQILPRGVDVGWVW